MEFLYDSNLMFISIFQFPFSCYYIYIFILNCFCLIYIFMFVLLHLITNIIYILYKVHIDEKGSFIASTRCNSNGNGCRIGQSGGRGQPCGTDGNWKCQPFLGGNSPPGGPFFEGRYHSSTRPDNTLK